MSHDPPRAAGTVLVVDDHDVNIRLLEHQLRADGYIVLTARDGNQAIAAVADGRPDIVLMDVRMPVRDGFSACISLKNDPDTRLIPVILMTAAAELADRVRAIEAGADDFLTRPIDVPELRARVRSLVRLKRDTDDLDSAESVILGLAMTVEARDPNTGGHCERLAAYGVALGHRLGLPEDDLAALRRGGFLHDIGKIAIPDAILTKPGKLTVEEFSRMKQHTIIGERLCGDLRALTAVRPIIRHHHEHLDGSGYPDGLRGADVPHLAQIIGVVDVYDALTTRRPYKSAMPMMEALDQLTSEVDCGWRDRHLVGTFAALVRTGEVPRPTA